MDRFVKAWLMLLVAVILAAGEWFAYVLDPGNDPITNAAEWVANVQATNPISQMNDAAKVVRLQMDMQTADLNRAANDMEGFDPSSDE